MSSKIHFWLLSAQVATFNEKTGEEQRASMNALLTTQQGYVTRKDIASGQQAVLGRFTTSVPQSPDRKIVDVFILSISALGEQTPEEFHAGFDETPAAANQVN